MVDGPDRKFCNSLGRAAQPGAFEYISRLLNWNIVQKASWWTQTSQPELSQARKSGLFLAVVCMLNSPHWLVN